MNLEDIARLSGVSRSTVSRVVNDDLNVKDSTRERVLDVIRRENYRPNIAARGLAAGHTRVIGLVIPVEVSTLFSDPYFPLLIQGVSAVCNAQDYLLMLWLGEPEYERQMADQILHSGLIGGVVLAAGLVNEPILQALAESKMPFVTIGGHPTLDRLNFVDVENVKGTQEAIYHLMGLGRRRIATIAGPESMVAGADRLIGYRNALISRDIPVDPALIVEGDFSELGGYVAMQQLLPQKPDAVFVANDNMAVGAMRAITQAGLSVPQDVALVGFDDMPVAVQLQPALTTVRQPKRRAGAAAANMLLDLIQNPREEDPHYLMLPTELIVRKSCGA